MIPVSTSGSPLVDTPPANPAPLPYGQPPTGVSVPGAAGNLPNPPAIVPSTPIKAVPLPASWVNDPAKIIAFVAELAEVNRPAAIKFWLTWLMISGQS